MTGQEIIDKLAELEIYSQEVGSEDMENPLPEGIGAWESVDSGNGDEEPFYNVIYFKDHDIYLKADGWYASHVGGEYDELFEVTPKEKTITIYS